MSVRAQLQGAPNKTDAGDGRWPRLMRDVGRHGSTCVRAHFVLMCGWLVLGGCVRRPSSGPSAKAVSPGIRESLVREITAWKKGSPPPPRLLKFPDGETDLIPVCGMRVWGSSVGDYISGIEDAELLAALIFHHRAQPDCFQAAVRQLVKLEGVGHLADLLAERRKTEPSAFTKSELAVLTQLLRSAYVAIKVAHIATEDMEPGKAESVLREMRAELEAGNPWPAAYRKFADLNPDVRDRAKNPKSIRTLICYLYDGVVSPSGFDILGYHMAERLPLEHLRELFRVKRGAHIFKADDGVYLYHIERHFDDAA